MTPAPTPESSSDDLIRRLSGELKPVRRLPPPLARFLVWLAVSGLVVFAEIKLSGPARPRVAAQLRESPRFMIETALVFLAPVFAGAAAFYFSVPGNERKRWVQWTALGMLAAFIGLLLYGLWSPALTPSGEGNRGLCMLDVPLYGVIPMVVLFAMLNQGAPLKWKTTSLLIAVASFVPVTAAMQIVCMYSPAHILFAHVLPVFILTFAVQWLGRRFLKR